MGSRDSRLHFDLFCFKEPKTVYNAPHVWPDGPREEKLAEARQEYVLELFLLTEASANHGSNARRERVEVQDGTDSRGYGLERHNSVSAERWATETTFKFPTGHSPIT